MNERSEFDELRRAIPERFDIREELGTGGFGTVFRVIDRKRGSVVALKLLHDIRPDQLYQFKREFRALADISHPNLIDLFEFFGEGDTWFFTMDYVDGIDFHSALRTSASEATDSGESTKSVDSIDVLVGSDRLLNPSSGSVGGSSDDASEEPKEGPKERSKQSTDATVDFDRVHEVFAGLVRGLHALHEYGKLHRDLKPDNVLVTESNRVVLLDFGLVAELDAPSGGSPGSDESAPGTPRYLAPELATDAPVTEAADWYSAGVMLFEVLTGEPPISGRTTIQELFLKNTQPAPDVREMAIDVPDTIAEICMDLLAIDPEDRPGGRELLSRLEGDSSPVPAASSGPLAVPVRAGTSTFVGRAEEIREMRRIARETFEGGGPALVHICGKSGVGKSALARRFLEDVEGRREDVVALWGRCYEKESVPYKALDGVVDEFVPIVDELPDNEIVEVLGDDLAALARLFPVFRRIEAIAHEDVRMSALSDGEVRNKGFEGLRRLLGHVAEKRPVLVCIDDVQWGDEDSVSLLEALIDGDDAPPVVCLMTWRVDDADASPFLSAWRDVESTLDDLRTKSFELSELSEEETRELAHRLTSGTEATEEDESLVERIVRESAGHPLFASELSRWMNRAAPVDGDWKSLEAVLEERFRLLSDPARAILQVVSVAGRPLNRELVAEVAGVQSEELSSLSLLRSQRFLRVRGDETERLETYHDRVRETMVEQLEPERVRAIHRKLAETLVERSDPDPSELASHFVGAGEFARAADYMIEASKAAADALAFERAVEYLRGALEYGEFSVGTRHDLVRRIAELHAAAGRARQSADVFLEAAESTEGLDATECRIEACDQLIRAGDIDRGRDLIYEQFEDLGFTPAKSRYRMIASIMFNRWRLNRRGFDYELQPREEIERAELLRLRAFWIATSMFGVTDILRGAYFHYHGILRSLEAGFTIGIIAHFCQQAAQDASRGVKLERVRELLADADDLISECEPHKRRWTNLPGFHLFIEGIVDCFEGRWNSALETIERSVATYEDSQSGFVWEREFFRYFVFECLDYLGDFETLRAQIPGYFDAAVDRGDSFHAVLARTKLAKLSLCDDDPAGADRNLKEAQRQWPKSGFHVQDFWILRNIVNSALYRGDAAAAARRLDKGWKPMQQSFVLYSENVATEAWNMYGQVAVSQYQSASGWEALWARLRIWRAIRKLRDRFPVWSDPCATLLEGRLAQIQGDLGSAADKFDRVERRFREIDMEFYARSIQFLRGRLSGGEEGNREVREAETWMRRQGIENPRAMARTVVGVWSSHDDPQLE